MKNSKTVYALLGWLSTGPMTGYDLKRMTDQYIGEFWYGSFGQIYPLLHQMLETGWVTQHEEKTGNHPPRKVYTITDAGRQEFARWFESPIEPEVVRSELLLRLFFGHLASPEILVRYMDGLLQASQARLAHYETLKREMESMYSHLPNFPYMMITLDRGFIVSRGFVEWAERTLATLRTLPSSTAPLPPPPTEF